MSELSPHGMVRRSRRSAYTSGSRSSCPFGKTNNRNTCGPAVAVIAGVPICRKHLDVIHAIEREAAMGPALAAKIEPQIAPRRKKRQRHRDAI